MTHFKKILTPFALFGALLVNFACEKEAAVVPAKPKTIVDVATGDTQFSTLAAALKKADLVTALAAPGPFTVFAPNNTAFGKAGITSLDALTKEALTPILTSHVVSGKVLAADVKNGTTKTLNTANSIYFSVNTTGVYINGNIKVIATDVNASNGVIHVIDNVIVPPTNSIVQIALTNPNFSELTSLVLAADASIGTTLTNASENGLTVFAPTNAAFQELYKTVPKATLLDPANKKLLSDVLLYHVVGGRVFSTDLPNVKGDVTTLNTAKIKFDLTSGAKVIGLKSGNSNIVTANVLATNGVIHIIDKVLLPQ
jgi:uncharacterized surface protein with fasciclin (FAS1) repeats